FSKSANASEEITKELALASKYKKYVVPARVEDVLPTEAFEYALADRQWIDLFKDWDKRVFELSDWIAEREASTPGASKAEDKLRTEYIRFREAFANRQYLDQSVVLSCLNIDPNPAATLSLSRVIPQYWESAD